MPDWDAPDVRRWKRKARALQQNMFLRLGDRKWDEWDKSDKTILYRKVGFALYSLPKNLPDEENNYTGYNEVQFKNIKRVSKVIRKKAKCGDDIHFACIFVFGKIYENRFTIPVFKVKGHQSKTLFVDTDCRVYENWGDYLNSNRLPKCMYCYPRDGLYQGDKKVLVDFGTSPACDLVNRIWSVFDTAATVVSLVSTPVMVASLFTVPIATPILAIAQSASAGAGVYLATRSYTTLVDRHQHDQSIGLEDPAARSAWLGIVGCGLGLAQSRMYGNITRAAAAGDVASRALRITYNVVSLGSLTVKGLGNLNEFISLVDKDDKGTLTPLDVYRFSTSLLFYSNSLLNVDTATDIIENTQQQVLNQHAEDLTASQIEELFRLSDQVRGRTQLHRNANLVRTVNRIGDKRAFFESLVTARRARRDREGH